MTTLILIGGQSSRMGQDKSLIVRPDGQRQIDWLIHLLKPIGPDILLSMREPGMSPVDLPVILDRHPGNGPMSALNAFHEECPGEAVLALSCDLFLLDEETLRYLVDHRDPSRAATCFANRMDGAPEPLCAIYEAGALAGASAWLARGERGARRYLKALDPVLLPLPHPPALDSANTPVELAECFSKLRHGVTEKRIHISHDLSSPAGRSQFSGEISTLANTIGGLIEETRFRLRLPRDTGDLRAFRNEAFCPPDRAVVEGDQITFRTGSSGT